MKVEFIERPANTEPIRFDHIHFNAVGAAPDGGNSATVLREWYAKVFGAAAGSSGVGPTLAPALELPGTSIRFVGVASFPMGTKGTAIDHVGFEVKDLENFCKKAEANGVKFDAPFTKLPLLGIANAFVTDPFGNYIELTEGLGRIWQ